MTGERGKWRWVNGEFVNYTKEATPQTHSVITDIIPDTWHPADNKYYSSKSKFREVTRAHGCIEYGNESLERKKVQEGPTVSESIRNAFELCRAKPKNMSEEQESAWINDKMNGH